MRIVNDLFLQLRLFERDIRRVISAFEEQFGVANPGPLWRQGKIDRIGRLNPFDSEFSLHGFGCTAEIGNKLASFDFDPKGEFLYSPFKFQLYLDDESLDSQTIVDFFHQLNQDGLLL